MGKQSREKRERRELGERRPEPLVRVRSGPGTPAWRDLIADAIHDGVCRAFGKEEAPLMCWAYAVSGAIALNVLAKREIYTYTAGTLGVRTGIEDWYFTLDPNDPQYAGVEYHAWIVSKPQDDQLGVSIAAPPDVEVIDLSARHYAAHAAHAGVPFSRPDIGRCVWSRFGDLPPLSSPQGLYFSSNMEATLGIQHMWPRHEAAVNSIIRGALAQAGR